MVPDLGLVSDSQCLDFFSDNYFQNLTFLPPRKRFSLVRVGSPLVQTQVFERVE